MRPLSKIQISGHSFLGKNVAISIHMYQNLAYTLDLHILYEISTIYRICCLVFLLLLMVVFHTNFDLEGKRPVLANCMSTKRNVLHSLNILLFCDNHINHQFALCQVTMPRVFLDADHFIGNRISQHTLDTITRSSLPFVR